MIIFFYHDTISYVVYPFEEKCHSDAWIDNTCLLVVDSFAPNEEFDLSEYVLNRRGLCLSLDSSPPGFAVGESYEIQLDGTNWIRHGTPSGGVLIQPSPQSKDLTSITAVLDKGFGLKCQNEHSKAAVIPSKVIIIFHFGSTLGSVYIISFSFLDCGIFGRPASR